MSSKLIIESGVKRLIHYLKEIEDGQVQIPEFQRDYVWNSNQVFDLFDSIKNNYPIGSVLFWKPEKEPFESQPEVGPYTIPQRGTTYLYILDGFQRLSTLFGCLLDHAKTQLKIDKDVYVKKFNVHYDLEKEEFFIPRLSRTLEDYQIPIYELINTKSSYKYTKLFNENYSEEKANQYSERYEKFGSTLIDYQLPYVSIFGGEIGEAVNIFNRVNSKGQEISPDWMISALSYNRDRNFRLGSLIDELTEELRVYNFENLKRELVLQCIINSFGSAFFDQSSKQLEDLAREPKFIDVSRRTIASIKHAVEFLFKNVGVIDVKLLPYNNQLIFITDFFNNISNPTEKQLEKLKKWFWITTYSSYFTIYSLSKIREGYRTFQKFLKDENVDPVYNDRPDIPFSVAEFPNKIYFGSVRAKALVLFLLQQIREQQTIAFNEMELSVNYLFYDMKDKNGNFYPEGVMPTLSPSSRSKDMSHMLLDYKEEYSVYFLTDEMSDLFRHEKKREILDLRKILISDAERVFVESLGLTYRV
jgi:hypothetical protein